MTCMRILKFLCVCTHAAILGKVHEACKRDSLPAVAHNIDGKAEQCEDYSGNAQRDGFAFASTDLNQVVVEFVLRFA